MAQPKPSIGREEWQLLRYVADHQPATVRQVADHMAQTTGKARTTILTVMERLREKGYLTRRKRGGVFHYTARHSKADVAHELVREFVRDALGGSVSPFVAYLTGEAEVSSEELEQLRQLVENLDTKGKDVSP
jgi:predicted transcriptional regulator